MRNFVAVGSWVSILWVFAISHWLGRSPLTQCWRYRAACEGRQIESRVWSIERRHFQWSWTTPTLSFQVTPFFDAEYLINSTTYRHSFNVIPIWTYTRSWVILSDLAKYSMTRCVVRSLCDSWATCDANWHNGQRCMGMKRSTLGIRRSKIKVTDDSWRLGGGITVGQTELLLSISPVSIAVLTRDKKLYWCIMQIRCFFFSFSIQGQQ